MVPLNSISPLLTNHINRVLNPAVRNNRDDRGINNTQALDTMDPEPGVNNTLLDILRQTSRTARVERGLGAVKHSALHELIVMQRHVPGIFGLDDILEPVAVLEHVVGVPDALADGDDVEVVVEVVQVDVGLLQGVGAVEGDLAALGDGADQVHHHCDVVALGGGWVVPLEGRTEETHEVELEMRLAVGAEGVFAAVGGLGLSILRVLLEVLVDAWEADHLEEAGAQGPAVVVLVGLDGLLVLRRVGAEDVVVHTVAVLDAEDEGDARVVEEVLADVQVVDDDGYRAS